MKKNMLLILLSGIIVMGLYSCDKNSNFNPQGGELPTHYIQFKDGVFSPSNIAEANGSNFTFLNSTAAAITLVGEDSLLLKTVVIGPNLSYFFKPDTIPPTPVQIFIPYHCLEIPTARGVIILNP
ncbi:MAG: hypothetical protein ABIT58_09790 [Ferruginibacter sp.]